MSEKIAAGSVLLASGAGNITTAVILVGVSALAIAFYKLKEKKRLKAQNEHFNHKKNKQLDYTKEKR